MGPAKKSTKVTHTPTEAGSSSYSLVVIPGAQDGEKSHLDIVKIRAMSSGKCMVTEERLNFQWVLRMPQEVRRITNHYEEENLSMLPWERLQKAVLRVS